MNPVPRPAIARPRRLRAPAGRTLRVVRRLLAAALTGLAAWLLTTQVGADQPAGRTVVVTAEPVAAGATVTAEALRTATAPEAIVPESALTDPGQATGRLSAGAVPAGTVLAQAHLVGPGLLEQLPAGSGLVHVPVSPPALAAAARPGCRIDVLGPDGSVLASDLLVLAGGGDDGVLVAADREQAPALASAAGAEVVGSTVQVVVHAP